MDTDTSPRRGGKRGRGRGGAGPNKKPRRKSKLDETDEQKPDEVDDPKQDCVEESEDAQQSCEENAEVQNTDKQAEVTEASQSEDAPIVIQEEPEAVVDDENTNADANETVETIDSQEDESEDNKVYLAPKRKTLKFTSQLIADVKQAFIDAGFTVSDVKSRKKSYSHAFLQLSSPEEVDKLISEFDDKLVAGIILTVKRKISRSDTCDLLIRPSNTNIKMDEEFLREISDEVKDHVHVLNSACSRDFKNGVFSLSSIEDANKIVDLFDYKVIGDIEIRAVKSADEEEDAEPFVFCVVRSGSGTFTPSLMSSVQELFDKDEIAVKKTNTASKLKYAFFFTNTWEDAMKFVQNRDAVTINGVPLHFEKGHPKTRVTTIFRGGKSRGFSQRGGNTGFVPRPPFRANYHMGGPSHPGGYYPGRGGAYGGFHARPAYGSGGFYGPPRRPPMRY